MFRGGGQAWPWLGVIRKSGDNVPRRGAGVVTAGHMIVMCESGDVRPMG